MKSTPRSGIFGRHIRRGLSSCFAAAIALSVSLGICRAQGTVKTSAAIQHVSPAEAKTLLAEKKPVVLDLRTPAEFAAGHIAGAVNIDFRAPDFAQQIAALDRAPRYVVHCGSGNRSGQALPLFQKLHFEAIYHLDGGITAWKEAGLPVE